MNRKAYDTDLTDAEWIILSPLFPAPKPTGRPRKWLLREILDGIFYVIRGGNAWRLMPHDLPPWPTVYHYHRVWRLWGLWEQVHTVLREHVRISAGRAATPCAAIIDSQSARTTEAGGPRGYDGGKKINGRKRHILVDTLGLVMGVVVHRANIQDRAGAVLVFNKVRNEFPRMKHVWADAGYTGELGQDLKKNLGWTLEIVKHPWSGNTGAWARIDQPPPPIDVPEGFVVLKRRWVVERTFSWFGKARRMSRDYEASAETTENLIYAVMIRLMVRRLARA
jgi:putative transposase